MRDYACIGAVLGVVCFLFYKMGFCFGAAHAYGRSAKLLKEFTDKVVTETKE